MQSLTTSPCRRLLPSLLFLFLTVLSSLGAPYTVKLAVCDSIGEPEIYATVRIYAENDSVKPACTGTTDYDGLYSTTLPHTGKYTLKLAATGKKPFETTFIIKGNTGGADLGKIVLNDNPELLQELTVTALRPLVKREIDRITFDVGADTDAPTSTLSETLSKVPLVTVDADGTIRVKGQTDFRIYKNNRPNSSYSNNAKELFKAIPATSIKRIEVITDPGAREDAEGTGLILNIVTDTHTRMIGVTGNINQMFTMPTMREGTNAYITTQIDKVTLSANGMFSYVPKTKYSRNTSEGETHYDKTGTTSRTESESRSASKFGYWGLEGSWEPDTFNLITFEASQWIPGSSHPDMKRTTSMTDSEGNLVQQYTSTYGDRYKVSSFYLDGAANYQRLTRRKDEAITLSYNFSVNRDKNLSNTVYTDLFNWDMPYEDYKQDSRRNYAEHTLQLDWSRPYFGISKLDIGGKLILRRNSSESTTRYDNHYLYINHFRHHTTVAALYADWRVKVKKWNFRAGVRYEYTYLSARSKTVEAKTPTPDDLDNMEFTWPSDGEDYFPEYYETYFRTELHDFVPNASIMYELNDENQFKLSYQRTIRRPGINYLDPTVNRLPHNVSYGNPGLQSATYDNISIGYEHMGTLNYMGSLYLNTSDDGFAQVSWVGEDGETIYNTYDNVGRKLSYGISQWLGWNGKKTRIYAGFDIDHNYFKQPTPDGDGHDVDISRGRWSMNPYIFFSQKLPWKLNLSVNLNYWSGMLSSAYSWDKRSFPESLYYSFSISRAFLKEDRLNVRLSANRPFGPAASPYLSYTSMPGSSWWTKSKYYGQQNVSISIGYRFGSLKAYVKKTNASISNDDVSGGASKGEKQD